MQLHSSTDRIFLESINSIAKALDDLLILIRVNNIEVGSKYFYHAICKKTYINDNIVRSASKKNEANIRDLHQKTSKKIFDFVKTKVIEGKNCYSLRGLTDNYVSVLSSFARACNYDFDSIFTPQHMLDKLLKYFKDQIQIITVFNKKLVAPREGCIVNEDSFKNINEFDEQTRVGSRIRKSILTIKKRALPKKLEAKHLIDGECKYEDIPKDLIELLMSIITDGDPRRFRSELCMRKIYSIAYDIVFATFRGKLKTSKHITFGMTLKSVTSSRRVIEMCNTYGHCCSYHVIEGLETEISFHANSKSTLCPTDTILLPDQCTGVAYDNFDRYVETRTGKDNLHDTVGILYQNIKSHDDDSDSTDSDVDQGSPLKKPRRSFIAVAPDITEYNKKLAYNDKLLPLDSPLRLISCPTVTNMKKIDFLWVL